MSCATGIQKWPFDEGGLRDDGGQCAGAIGTAAELIASRWVQSLPAGAAFCHQGWSQLLEPRAHLFELKTVSAEIVKAVVDALIRQPAAGLSDGIAVGDAVVCDGAHIEIRSYLKRAPLYHSRFAGADKGISRFAVHVPTTFGRSRTAAMQPLLAHPRETFFATSCA